MHKATFPRNEASANSNRPVTTNSQECTVASIGAQWGTHSRAVTLASSEAGSVTSILANSPDETLQSVYDTLYCSEPYKRHIRSTIGRCIYWTSTRLSAAPAHVRAVSRARQFSAQN
eukprot:6205896-Pleurochrysis_carterae.AAC.2